MKWGILKFRQLESVLLEKNTTIKWTEEDEKNINKICETLDSIKMSTEHYNQKLKDKDVTKH